MLSPKIRFVVIAFFLICGLATIFLGVGGLPTIAFWGTSLILLIGHFRHGSILQVLHALRSQEIEKAKELLQTIKRPDWLNKRFKGYYYFCLSLIATYSQDLDAADSNAQKALEIGNLPEEEQAILFYNIARAAFEKKKWKKAKKQMEKLMQIPIKDLHLKKRRDELQTILQKY